MCLSASIRIIWQFASSGKTKADGQQALICPLVLQEYWSQLMQKRLTVKWQSKTASWQARELDRRDEEIALVGVQREHLILEILYDDRLLGAWVATESRPHLVNNTRVRCKAMPSKYSSRLDQFHGQVDACPCSGVWRRGPQI